MRSKKGKQGVKRRANWSLLGQNCAEPWQNWYILYIYSFTYPKRYSKLNFLNFVHPPLQRAMKSFIMPVSLCPARFLVEQASQAGCWAGHWLSASISPAARSGIQTHKFGFNRQSHKMAPSQLKSHICPAFRCWEVFFLGNALSCSIEQVIWRSEQNDIF